MSSCRPATCFIKFHYNKAASLYEGEDFVSEMWVPQEDSNEIFVLAHEVIDCLAYFSFDILAVSLKADAQQVQYFVFLEQNLKV